MIGPRGTPLGGASVGLHAAGRDDYGAILAARNALFRERRAHAGARESPHHRRPRQLRFLRGAWKIHDSDHGPNLTTRVLPDVILPSSDPSAPTFSTLTTTSGITAFSLSLGGDLTVAGNSAVTGTLTVGGAPALHGEDLQWSSSRALQGANSLPRYFVLRAAGSCRKSIISRRRRGHSGELDTLTISGGAYTATKVRRRGVRRRPELDVEHAGDNLGFGSYLYRFNHLLLRGCSGGQQPRHVRGLPHTCISNGVATLGRDSYNFLWWTGVSNAVAYVSIIRHFRRNVHCRWHLVCRRLLRHGIRDCAGAIRALNRAQRRHRAGALHDHCERRGNDYTHAGCRCVEFRCRRNRLPGRLLDADGRRGDVEP